MNKLQPFEYWVQRTLPQVYDDSLSYSELIGKVVYNLNEVIVSQNGAIDQVDGLLNWFNKLDVQDEIDNKLDDLVLDGTLDKIINHNIFNELSGQVSDITNNQTIVIGNGTNKTNSVQKAIDNIAPGGEVVLKGEFQLERIKLKSDITLNLSDAVITCLQPLTWTQVNNAGVEYTRTISLEGVKNVTIVDGTFKGINSSNDRTSAIYIGSSSDRIFFKGTQKFNELSWGVELKVCSNIVIDSLFGNTLNGQYANGDLRASVVNAKEAKNVTIYAVTCINSRKDVVYVGSDSVVGQNKNWVIGSIISQVTLSDYGFSNGLHLRSIDGITIDSVFVDGGYTGVDIATTTPSTTGDNVKNVAIKSITVKNVKERDSIRINGATGGFYIDGVKIDNVQIDNGKVYSASTGNLYILLAKNVLIQAVTVTNSDGNGVRVVDSSNVKLGNVNVDTVSGNGVSIRGNNDNVTVDVILVNKATSVGVDLANGKNLAVDTVIVKNTLNGVIIGSSFIGVEIKSVYVENADYCLSIQDTVKNVVVEMYDFLNVTTPLRGGTGYLVPRENKVSVKRKNQVVFNPVWADGKPTAGTWKRGDIVYNMAPSANGFVGYVCVADGTPGTWKGFGAIEA